MPGVRLIGQDKIAPEFRRSLAKAKAIRQGLQLRRIGRHGYPALWVLPAAEQESVRREVCDRLTWEASAPRYTTDGRRYA